MNIDTDETSKTRLWRRTWALVPLRFVVGLGFSLHGYAKLLRGPEHFAEILAALSVPAPHALAWITTVVELLGGAGMIAGAFVVPVSIVLSGVMLTAMLSVHLPYGFSSVRLLAVTQDGARFGPVGYELPLLYLVALAALATSGPTPMSIDSRIARRRHAAGWMTPKESPEVAPCLTVRTK